MLCDQKYLVWPECAKSDISSFPEERVRNERQVGQMRGKGARQEARRPFPQQVRGWVVRRNVYTRVFNKNKNRKKLYHGGYELKAIINFK